MIKILRIIARLNIGGPAIHVHLLTKGLDGSKFESILLTGSLSPEEGDMGYLFESEKNRPKVIPELQREIHLFSDLKVIYKIFKLIQREKPDIVHTHTAKAGTVGRIAAIIYNLFRNKKVKMVHTFHGHVFEGYFGKIRTAVFIRIERFLASRTDRILAISKAQKRDLSEKYRIAPSPKIEVIELGFDLEPFLSSAAFKGQFRKSMGVGEDAILIGIVGRLVPIKNHQMFLQGARLFLERHPDLKVKFAIIGDGELREELEASCQGLVDHVIFCGWIKDLVPVYADLDILALTSDNEGTPVSIIEAMASSVPAIATDVGGVADLMGAIGNRVSSDDFMKCERGILCRRGDKAGFAKGLKFLVEADIQVREAFIRRARSFVEKEYSCRRLFMDVEALYLNLTDQWVPLQ